MLNDLFFQLNTLRNYLRSGQGFNLIFSPRNIRYTTYNRRDYSLRQLLVRVQYKTELCMGAN